MSFGFGGKFEMTRITRVEVIDENGRSYVNWKEDNDITLSYQDDGRTLKVFVNKVKPKSPAEEAFKKVYGAYPMGEPFWIVFKKGYDASKVSETPQEPEDNEWKTVALGFGENLSAIGPDGYYDFTPVEWYDWVVDIYENTANEYLKLLQKERAKAKSKEPEKEQQIKELVRESVKWCEEHPDESVEDYLRPKTPEQTEKSLKEAFVKAQQTEEWKETQRKIDAPKESWMNKSDEELIAILEKNPPDCLKFVMGKTLEQIIERWWCDTFTGPHEKWSMEECIDDLIDQIELFLPRSQSSEGTQNIDTVVAVEAHNELLQKIKSKLRNKKDT